MSWRRMVMIAKEYRNWKLNIEMVNAMWEKCNNIDGDLVGAWFVFFVHFFFNRTPINSIDIIAFPCLHIISSFHSIHFIHHSHLIWFDSTNTITQLNIHTNINMPITMKFLFNCIIGSFIIRARSIKITAIDQPNLHNNKSRSATSQHSSNYTNHTFIYFSTNCKV